MADKIQVEITDPTELHCFRVLLNPQGHDPTCIARMIPEGAVTEGHCSCGAEGRGVRIEIMFHARDLVDLIHKCSVALCEWQSLTTRQLLMQKTGLDETAMRKLGLIADAHE